MGSGGSLSVTQEQSNRGLLVKIVGAIEENVDLETLIGPVSGLLQIHCRGITRINSVGVKMWMRYFQSLHKKNIEIEFLECSPAVVEQLNLISNFTCGGNVVSILLPFVCTKCKNDFVASMTTQELRAAQLVIPALKCEKPECAAEFDDDPSEYLYFLGNE